MPSIKLVALIIIFMLGNIYVGYSQDKILTSVASFKVQAEGNVYLTIKDGSVSIRAPDYRPPKIFEIDGKQQILKWNAEKISGPYKLKKKISGNISVKNIKVRSELLVDEQPSSNNDYTAVIRIIDRPAGSAVYEFELMTETIPVHGNRPDKSTASSDSTSPAEAKSDKSTQPAGSKSAESPAPSERIVPVDAKTVDPVLVAHISKELELFPKFDRQKAEKEVCAELGIASPPLPPKDKTEIEKEISEKAELLADEKFPKSIRNLVQKEAQEKFRTVRKGEKITIPIMRGNSSENYTGTFLGDTGTKLLIGDKTVLKADLPANILEKFDEAKLQEKRMKYVKSSYSIPRLQYKNEMKQEFLQKANEERLPYEKFQNILTGKEKSFLKKINTEAIRKSVDGYVEGQYRLISEEKDPAGRLRKYKKLVSGITSSVRQMNLELGDNPEKEIDVILGECGKLSEINKKIMPEIMEKCVVENLQSANYQEETNDVSGYIHNQAGTENKDLTEFQPLAVLVAREEYVHRHICKIAQEMLGEKGMIVRPAIKTSEASADITGHFYYTRWVQNKWIIARRVLYGLLDLKETNLKLPIRLYIPSRILSESGSIYRDYYQTDLCRFNYQADLIRFNRMEDDLVKALTEARGNFKLPPCLTPDEKRHLLMSEAREDLELSTEEAEKYVDRKMQEKSESAYSPADFIGSCPTSFSEEVLSLRKEVNEEILKKLKDDGYLKQLQGPFIFRDNPLSFRLNVTGFVDENNKIIIEPKFYEADRFSEGMAAVRITDDVFKSWGFIDMNGEIIIKPNFAGARSFSEELAAVNVRDKDSYDVWGYIDKGGNFVIKPQFCWNVSPFSEGLAAVESAQNLYGYIDRTGIFVIEPKFYNATEFSEGLAAVAIDTRAKKEKKENSIYLPYYEDDPPRILKWGFIDKAGNYIIPPKYDYAEPFIYGYASVSIDGGTAFIDKTGKVIITINPSGEYYQVYIDNALDDVQYYRREKSKPYQTTFPGYLSDELIVDRTGECIKASNDKYIKTWNGFGIFPTTPYQPYYLH